MLKVWKIRQLSSYKYLTTMLFAVVISCSYAYAANNVITNIELDSSTSSWWLSTQYVQFFSGAYAWILAPNWIKYTSYYIDKDTDSTIEWDFLSWYYWDNQYWFFQLDWSADITKNVRVIWSTNRCGTSYGFILWWYAKSIGDPTNLEQVAWFMNFHYDDDHYVYFCKWDGKIYWEIYNEDFWVKSFWLWLQFLPMSYLFDLMVTWTWSYTWATVSSFFLNDRTNIMNEDYEWVNSIQWDIVDTDKWKEMIFYIIK